MTYKYCCDISHFKSYGMKNWNRNIILGVVKEDNKRYIGMSVEEGAGREVFFVSGAKRKSQKTRGLRRETVFFTVSVHREACYCSRSEQWRPGGFAVNDYETMKGKGQRWRQLE